MAAAALIYCQDAKDLLDAYLAVTREVIKFHEDQFQAVLRGDDDSGRFDDLIYIANQRKHEAKYAYLRHLEAHNCSKVPDDSET